MESARETSVGYQLKVQPDIILTQYGAVEPNVQLGTVYPQFEESVTGRVNVAAEVPII